MAPLPGLSEEQLQKAIESLLRFIGQQKESKPTLFDENETIYLSISLKEFPNQPRKDKPICIPIPHPLFTAEGAEVCLFVKDFKEGHKKEKKKLAQLEAPGGGVKKIIGLDKLKTKYSSHEARRQLCSQYDIFLADDRILPSLPKLIGKAFFKKKKQPIPISLTGKQWAGKIRHAVEATYLFPCGGSCVNIRVAHSGMTAQQVQENALAVITAAADRIPKRWSNVQALFLKTASSVALPVYQTLELGQPLGIGMAAAS